MTFSFNFERLTDLAPLIGDYFVARKFSRNETKEKSRDGDYK